MAKVIKCGPRGIWMQSDGTLFTQIIKYVQSDDGSCERFVLETDGEWHPYGAGHAFSREQTFVTGATDFRIVRDLNGAESILFPSNEANQ